MDNKLYSETLKLQGFWFSREVSMFQAQCQANGMWSSFMDDLTCSRVSCPELEEKRHSSRVGGNLFAGGRCKLCYYYLQIV